MSRLIKLRVTEVRLAVPASVGVEAGMIVLTEDIPPGRALRIIIGQAEARAIHAAWDGSIPSRPSTWDLFVSAIALLGGRIDRAVITGVEQERHYFARIEMEQDGEHRTLSCRPSDAVALALRSYEAGVFAEETVLDEAGVLPDGTKPGRTVPTVPADNGAEPVAPADPVDPAAARERELAEREAALAARERELAEREASMGGPGADRAPSSPAGQTGTEPVAGVDQVVADRRPAEAEPSAVGNPPAGTEQPDHL